MSSDPVRRTGMLFDLDGTLIDSVYQHVLAWREALEAEGIDIPVWSIHRKIGMSGGLFARALLRETGADLTAGVVERLQAGHRDAFARYAGRGPAAARRRRACCSTSPAAACPGPSPPAAGARPPARRWPSCRCPTTCRSSRATWSQRAKPDPDLFLAAAAALGLPIEDCIVVGDSVWDLLAAQRARALGIGLLSGGYGKEELERAGAFRVYEDPGDLIAPPRRGRHQGLTRPRCRRLTRRRG